MLSLHIDTAKTWRGGQKQVMLTVLGLRATGCKTVLLAHPQGELFRRMNSDKDLFPIAARSEGDLFAAWKLSSFLQNIKPAIVHVHDAHGLALAAVAIRFLRTDLKPKLIASRRVDFHLKTNVFSRWKYRQVDQFICASSFIRTLLISNKIPTNKITVIYEGIDIKSNQKTDPLNIHAEFRVPEDSLIVGNVAALVPHKGQRYLVDAAAQVIRQVPNARFFIAGEGSLAVTLQNQISRLGLKNHVFLTGFRNDVLSMIKSFDLFVMSSTTEGLGTSALDAMACETPVIATRAGGLSEVIVHGQSGLLVPAKNAEALASGIIEMLRNESFRLSCSLQGLKRAEKKFSATRMVEETLMAYKNLVDTNA
tara:strand:+ start:1234 stop:2331 length:1098 start_codon:yes stop_codon:yes gene_type:complete